jgi:Protein of unknown function (DUF1236)
MRPAPELSACAARFPLRYPGNSTGHVAIAQGNGMKTFLAGLIALTMLLAGAAAHAQLLTQGEVATPRLKLTLEQEHVIKEFIKDMKLDPPATAARAAVGDAVPQDTTLRPMPDDLGRKVPQIKTHRFIYTPDRILIVDPKDNRVADVIELKD